MTNKIDNSQPDTVFLELSQKEAHLIKIIRNIAYGDITIKKQANVYVIATINQSIRLEDDPKKQITVRDSRNIGIPDVSIQG